MRLVDLAKCIFRWINPVKAKELKGVGSIKNFYKALERERCRADRSGMPFALVSFEAKSANLDGNYGKRLAEAICSRMRTTDEVGWIDHQHIGLILYNTNEKGAWSLVYGIKETISIKNNLPECKVYVYPNDRVRNNRHNKDDQDHLEKYFDYVKEKSGNNFKEIDDKTVKSSNMLVSDPSVSFLNNSMEAIQDIRPLFARKMPLWKRSLDIFGALFGLIILSPIFLLITVIIKSFSQGPVFFKQERIGISGKKFMIWKFRTMNHNADTSIHQKYVRDLYKNGKPMHKLEDDPRIIPFGTILRMASLDELPQLINVLLGDMSLVGPRPDVEYAVNEYESWQFARFDVVPGMTGLWQVSGKNKTSLRRMVSLDVIYKRRRSFWNDLKILFLTLPAIIGEFKAKSPSKNSLNYIQ